MGRIMSISRMIFLIFLLLVLLEGWSRTIPLLFPRVPTLNDQCTNLLAMRYAIAVELHNAQDERRRNDMQDLLTRGEELLGRCEELGWRQP